MSTTTDLNQFQRMIMKDEVALKAARIARDELPCIPTHRTADIIDNLAKFRLERFEDCKIEGIPWGLDEGVTEESTTLYEKEYNWDYGWFKMLAWLMRKNEFLAFFALLAYVDTTIQETVLSEIAEELPAAVYKKLIYWDHTYLGDAASVSYQKFRRPTDSPHAYPFSDKIRVYNIDNFFKEFPLWQKVLDKKRKKRKELEPTRKSARLQEKEHIRKLGCSEEEH